jgi:hypothetical protein
VKVERLDVDPTSSSAQIYDTTGAPKIWRVAALER